MKYKLGCFTDKVILSVTLGAGSEYRGENIIATTCIQNSNVFFLKMIIFGDLFKDTDTWVDLYNKANKNVDYSRCPRIPIKQKNDFKTIILKNLPKQKSFLKKYLKMHVYETNT